MKKEYSKGRVFMGRLPFGGDLLAEIEKLAAETGVSMGFIRVLGAVSRGAYAFYNQQKRAYTEMVLEEPLEIISCYGNLSKRDGKEKAHVHVTYSGSKGECVAGHLINGAVVFAAEYYFEELIGDVLHRGYDEETGLPLWMKG